MSLSVATPKAVTSLFTATSSLSGLLDTYGDMMTPEQIPETLEYSVTYVSKKIGNADYQHLPWVSAIGSHRRKRGSRGVYATVAVALYLDGRK